MQIPIRELWPSERPELYEHFLSLGRDDRRLRFGAALGDSTVRAYVARIDFGQDAVFGVLIAFWLVWGAWQASSDALDQLMDKEWPDDLRERFLAAAKEYPELAGLHDFRTRTSGTHQFAQFHVWVPADWTVQEAHDRLDRAEEDLRERFPNSEILIHVDPEGQTDRETLLPQAITERAT